MPNSDVFDGWAVILRALRTEPQAVHRIRGASGYEHSVVAVGVDRSNRRLIVISPEASPRVAAMVQADLQAIDDSIQVVTLRPILFDPGLLYEAVTSEAGTTEVTREEMWEALQLQGETLGPRLELVGRFIGEDLGLMPVESYFPDFAHLLSLQGLPEESPFIAEREEDAPPSAVANSKVDVSIFQDLDVLAGDREAGICPLPLVQFDPTDLEAILAGEDDDRVAEILEGFGVAPYFFPHPDYTALGLLERHPVAREEVDQRLSKVPALGHPYSSPALVPSDTRLDELIDAMEERGLLVEGEVSVVVTEEGREVRSSVKFEPQESLLTKLINRFEFRVNLADLFTGA